MKRAIRFIIGVALATMLSACGPNGSWTAQITDESGAPIVGATISLVPLFGDIQELNDQVQGGKPLYGWHFTTDDHGNAALQGIPHGGYQVATYTPPSLYTYNSSATGRVGGTPYYDNTQSTLAVPGQTTYRYVPGQRMGLIVSAPGYHGLIGWVQLNRSGGRTRIKTNGTQSPTFKFGSIHIRLEREPKLAAR